MPFVFITVKTQQNLHFQISFLGPKMYLKLNEENIFTKIMAEVVLRKYTYAQSDVTLCH
jgi:hypothetical protein